MIEPKINKKKLKKKQNYLLYKKKSHKAHDSNKESPNFFIQIGILRTNSIDERVDRNIYKTTITVKRKISMNQIAITMKKINESKPIFTVSWFKLKGKKKLKIDSLRNSCTI